METQIGHLTNDTDLVINLKRAVSSNLPCFFINFDETVKEIPSSTHVAIMLKKLFIENNLEIKELSMCIQAGQRRFKFAVADKAAFLNIYNWSWASEIDNKKIEVVKPRSLPDCYALVVRYILMDVKQDEAKLEILKAIPDVVSFSSITYNNRQQPSYDIRFNVRNLEQFETVQQLGRICIGHYYLPLTHFLSGYKLTYCTACWKLGHMREKCRSPVRCRKCLKPYVNGVRHECTKDELQCAQCNGNHFSLDTRCPIVKQYKDELKIAVDKAINAGTIHRPAPGELTRPFQIQESDFPRLNQATASILFTKPTTDNPTTATNLKQEIEVLILAIKSLSDTITKTEKNLSELNNRLEAQEIYITNMNKGVSMIIESLNLIAEWHQCSISEKAKRKQLQKKIIKSIDALQPIKQNPTQITIKAPSSSTKSTPANNIKEGHTSNEDHSMNSIDANE